MFNLENYKKDLASLIACESVLGNPEDNAPFGQGVKKALNTFLQIASNMGFETINYDNYAGEVVIGSGKEFGIIGHLDVVAVGPNWDTYPFTLTERDGFLYGRGVNDDIGPTLLQLYVIKDLVDSGVKFNKKIRLILGCNEESYWKDIDYLKEHTTLPEDGYSPDGTFPTSYSEKGMVCSTFYIPKMKRFSGITSGSKKAVNIVCDYASVVANSDAINKDLIKELGLVLNEDGKTIESFGLAAHGSTPRKGKNAIKPLFEYCIKMGEDDKDLIEAYELIFMDKYHMFDIKNEQGALTINAGIIQEEGDEIVIICDTRVPPPLKTSILNEIFDKTKLKYTLNCNQQPHMVDKNSWIIKTLLSAYNSIMNENAKAKAMSGCSFARVFKNGCTFGPEFIGEDSKIHQANERVEISKLKQKYKIYYNAIYNIVKDEEKQ